MSPYDSDLLEYMKKMQPLADELGPTSKDKEQALAMTILGASAGLLGARRGQVWPALGQGLLGGVQMGQDYLRNTTQDRQRSMLSAMNMQERQRAWAEREAFRRAGAESLRPDGTVDYRALQQRTMGLNPQFGIGLQPQVDEVRANEALANANNQAQTAPYVPTPEPGQSAPPMSPVSRGPMGGAVDAAMAAQMTQFASLMRQADALEKAGLGAKARQYREEARKLIPSPDARLSAETTQRGQDLTAAKLVWHDLGDRLQAFDPRTTKPFGDPIDKRLSPDAYARMVESRNQAYAAMGAPAFDSATGSFIYKPMPNMPPLPGPGSSIPQIVGGGAPAQGAPAQPAPAPSGMQPAPGPVAAAPVAPAQQRPPAGTGGAVPVPGYQKPLDATAQQMVRQNKVTLSGIQTAINLITAYPNALGPLNMAPFSENVRQYTDPQGIPVRAIVAGLGGQKFHDMSGAAVTITEATRLKAYIPSVSDTPAAAIAKLRNLQREYNLMQQELLGGASLAAVVSRNPSFSPTADPDVDAARKAMQGQ